MIVRVLRVKEGKYSDTHPTIFHMLCIFLKTQSLSLYFLDLESINVNLSHWIGNLRWIINWCNFASLVLGFMWNHYEDMKIWELGHKWHNKIDKNKEWLYTSYNSKLRIRFRHWSNFFVYQAKFLSFCITGLVVDQNFSTILWED